MLRVPALAERIAAAEGADGEVVRTAALLHDVAESEDRETHHLLGAQRARALLAGEPDAFVDAVAHAIEAHRFRHDPQPQTLEAKVLSDADKLDSIGAIGIGRAFAFGGRPAPRCGGSRSPRSSGKAATPGTGRRNWARATRPSTSSSTSSTAFPTGCTRRWPERSPRTGVASCASSSSGWTGRRSEQPESAETDRPAFDTRPDLC